MDLSVLLGILSGVLQLVGYWLYARHLLRSEIRPNSASWFIWAYGSLVEASSYFEMSGDVVKSILPMTCAVACIVTFFLIMRVGQFKKLKTLDYVCVAIDVTALIVWWVYQSATYAHLVAMSSVIISFVPIIWDTWSDPRSEKPMPWLVWTTAYAVATAVVFMRFEKWEDVVYSGMYFVCHIPVLLISRYKTADA
jgi:hypothetical protein